MTREEFVVRVEQMDAVDSNCAIALMAEIRPVYVKVEGYLPGSLPWLVKIVPNAADGWPCNFGSGRGKTFPEAVREAALMVAGVQSSP